MQEFHGQSYATNIFVFDEGSNYFPKCRGYAYMTGLGTAESVRSVAWQQRCQPLYGEKFGDKRCALHLEFSI